MTDRPFDVARCIAELEAAAAAAESLSSEDRQRLLEAAQALDVALQARPDLPTDPAAYPVAHTRARFLKASRELIRSIGADAERAVRGARRRLGQTESPARKCYVCLRAFERAHPQYPRLCEKCGQISVEKREQSADLGGKVALVTGGRIRIGHETALKLLRCGARVLVTSRFPKDTARRFADAYDYDEWAARLEVFGLDFRFVGAVEAFADHVVETERRLDVLVNNAAQTVRRPATYYRPLLEGELQSLPPRSRRVLATDADFHGETGGRMHPLLGGSTVPLLAEGTPEGPTSALLSQLPVLPEDRDADDAWFPRNQVDEHGEPADLRPENSWSQSTEDVPLAELLEVQLINTTAPFVLTSRLKPLMARDAGADKWVINVTSREGDFSNPRKETKHPHTNMAKAALNMLTRTAAQDYATSRIWVNSVDTGWVSHLRPRREVGTEGPPIPLDPTDAAARILDPIFSGIRTGKPVYGKLFKDYCVYDW